MTVYVTLYHITIYRYSLISVQLKCQTNQVSLCEQALIPLRGLVNESYWRLHPLYTRHYAHDCTHIREGRSKYGDSNNLTVIDNLNRGYIPTEEDLLSTTCCTDDWMNLFRLKAVKIY